MPPIPADLSELPPDLRRAWIKQSRLLLDCHERLLGHQLMARTGDELADATALYGAPFAALSHGTQSDPILNFANRTALTLWQMTPEVTAREGLARNGGTYAPRRA